MRNVQENEKKRPGFRSINVGVKKRETKNGKKALASRASALASKKKERENGKTPGLRSISIGVEKRGGKGGERGPGHL